MRERENDLYFWWKLVFLFFFFFFFLEFGMVNLVTEGQSLGGKKLIFEDSGEVSGVGFLR